MAGLIVIRHKFFAVCFDCALASAHYDIFQTEPDASALWPAFNKAGVLDALLDDGGVIRELALLRLLFVNFELDLSALVLAVR